MNIGEIIRIIIFTLLGAALMFLVQPWLYRSLTIAIVTINPQVWLRDEYTPGAWVVFGLSVFSTLSWYFLAATAKVKGAVDVFRWQLIWWLLLFLPILGICIALYVFNKSPDTLLSLTSFLIIDGVVILFWLPTATSSPGLFQHIPPGSLLLRRLIGS